MRRVLRDERGMALAVAIFALVVAGALIAGAFFAGTQEQRVGQNTLRVQQSFGAGEEGMNEILQTWYRNISLFNTLGFYPTDSAVLGDSTTAGNTGKYTTVIRRLNDHMYLMDVVGRDRSSAAGKTYGAGARQRFGLLLRARTLQLPITAALTTTGTVQLNGNVSVSGYDSIPQGWNTSICDTTGVAPKAGVTTGASPDTVIAHGGGSSKNAKLQGSPGWQQDPTLDPTDFTQFGDVNYNDLAAMATVTLPAGTYQVQPSFVGSTCNTADNLNWGDGLNQTSDCGSYWPIVHITGDATLNGVQGQGILLVDGDLAVGGGFIYDGIVIVQGTLSATGGGATDSHFYGAVLAQGSDITPISGSANIVYSECAVTAALNKSGIVVPDRSRSWSQLY